MHYNFVRIHGTLRVTPAMEAGVTDRLWSLEDMVGVVDEREAAQKAQKAENFKLIHYPDLAGLSQDILACPPTNCREARA